MNLEDLTQWRAKIAHLSVERGRLGGFDAHAETIISILQAQMAMIDHLIAKEREGKKK